MDVIMGVAPLISQMRPMPSPPVSSIITYVRDGRHTRVHTLKVTHAYIKGHAWPHVIILIIHVIMKQYLYGTQLARFFKHSNLSPFEEIRF